MLSVIIEDHALQNKKIDSKLAQTISTVLTHNPSYFTKYFHNALFDFVNFHRCEQNESQVLLRVLYKDLFGQPYIDFETRHQSESQRNEIMNTRIEKFLDPNCHLTELCVTVDSFLNKKMSFYLGTIIGEWGDEELKIGIRKRRNGDFYMVQTYFDSAFPVTNELVSQLNNKFKKKSPFSTRSWAIRPDGSLDFKYTDNVRCINYPIYKK